MPPLMIQSLPLGLLRSGGNLLTFSEDFSNAIWVKTRVTVTADALAAPDGSLTADKILENAIVDSNGYVAQTFNSSGGAYAGSVFVKAGEATSASIALVDTGGFVGTSNTTINLTTGGKTAGGGLIADAGNGWWRVMVTGVPLVGVCSVRVGFAADTGVANNGFYAWGAQLESGSIATPYRARGA